MGKIKAKINFKNILTLSVILFLLIAAICFLIQAVEYNKYNKEANKSISSCYSQDNTVCLTDVDKFNYGSEKCYEKMYHLILPKLLIYKAKINNKVIDDIYRISYMYSSSEELLKQSDAILSYGIGDIIGFEKFISKNYDIPIYLFDCGVSDKEIAKINKKYKNIHAKSECLSTDKYLMYNQKSSHKIHSLGQKLKELNLQDKKIYLKLGIPELREYVDDILKYKNNIIAISTVADFHSPRHIVDYYQSFTEINKSFVLVSRSNIGDITDYKYPTIKYVKSEKPFRLTLLYVNKKYVNSYYLPWNQNALKRGYVKDLTKNKPYFEMSISPIVVFFEKIKLLKRKFI